MNYTDIVKKLVGNIQPQGKTEVDIERFSNLKAMCALVDDLVAEIDSVHYKHKEMSEHSIKEMAQYANDFLTKTLGISE